MLSSALWAFLAFLVISVDSAAIHIYEAIRQNETSPIRLPAESPLGSSLKIRAADPSDFSWVKNWAAIGDSFTAGIGSGNTYSSRKEDVACSRYDYAYPAIVNRFLGPSVRSFQYAACSGARSTGIADQITALTGGLDLVMMTAGGNDLCLASIIKTCIFLPLQSEQTCDDIINIALNNIQTILKPNIRELLDDLNDKMADNSIVILNLYAKYFNTETDECETDQNWSFPSLFNLGLPLSIDRRTRFNDLVDKTNAALQSVADDVAKDTTKKYKISTADWDPWPIAIGGQFCQPGKTGQVSDPANADVQFFKRTTSYASNNDHMELKRELTEEQRNVILSSVSNIYYSGMFMSSSPGIDVLHQLDKRTPAPPNCPSDGGFDWTFGFGVPDKWGKFFHPNKLGHETITAFALDAVQDIRAEILGVENPSCAIKDEFTCWQKTGSHGYVTPDRMVANFPDFCKNAGAQAPSNTLGWKYTKSYHEGTPDEHSFTIQLSPTVGTFDEEHCLDALGLVVNACDGDDPKNPLGFKFGGKRVAGEYTYTADVKRTNRPWPFPTKPVGRCEGWWKVFFSHYDIYGGGWSAWDNGQQTLLPSCKGCFGNGVTLWSFEYYDEPDNDGYEWHAHFNTPVFVKARCFANNKVVMASGGFTDGCAGNDA